MTKRSEEQYPQLTPVEDPTDDGLGMFDWLDEVLAKVVFIGLAVFILLCVGALIARSLSLILGKN